MKEKGAAPRRWKMASDKTGILYLRQILLEETDEEHILTAADLAEKLSARHGISLNRKTIYADIERLREAGMKIEQKKGDRFGYYVGERDFTLPELKLLVDAVQASKFITTQKSEDLIRKLEKLTGKKNARELQRQVFIYNRPKAENETIFASVDLIHSAIYMNRQITFTYCEWNIRRQLVPRKGGKVYRVSPWSLTWDDENYYLVAYEEESGLIKHYRVDKMKDMLLTEEERLGRELFENFDLAAFSMKTFGMFGGRDETVSLYCTRPMAGVVIDRFGQDIIMVPKEDGAFTTHVLVSVSPQFYGWIAGLGGQVRILGPENVRNEFRDYLDRLRDQY